MTTVACSERGGSPPGDDPKLIVLGAEGGSLKMGIPRVPPNASWVIEGVTLCLEAPAELTLTRVDAVGADVAVVDFAVRDNPAWDEGDTFGTELRQDYPGDLAAAGFDRSMKTVSHTCKAGTGQGHELAIETRSPAEGVAKIKRFDLFYHRDGEEAATRIPLAVTLCPYRSASHPKCTFDPDRADTAN
jgi:hypothetical protein